MKQDKSPPTAGDIAADRSTDATTTSAPGTSADASSSTSPGTSHGADRIADRYEGGAVDAQPATSAAQPGPSRRERAGDAARSVGRGASWARSRLANLLWLVAVLCAVVLGTAALLVALEANPENGLVAWVQARAGQLDGPFYDIFTFSGADAAKKQVLVGWGLAAVAYLVVGRVVERLVRP